MTLTRHSDGRAIISENETYWTNECGHLMRRLEQVLEDGTEIIQDLPVEGSIAAGYPPQASAPMEDEINIPIVQAITVPAGYDNSVATQTYPMNVPSSPVAVVTGPPQPPSVAVVTGPPRPPPQVYYPSSRYVYRDERTGACMICGLSALICLSICCCCLLPFIIVPIVVVPMFKDVANDDFFGMHDDNV